MATTLTTLNKSWDRTRSVRTGHFACYFPGNASPADTLVLFGPDGRELARNTEGLRDFDLAIDEATGDLFALYCAFVDGDARPIRRWNTGVKVPPRPRHHHHRARTARKSRPFANCCGRRRRCWIRSHRRLTC
jgi:hypothetical protein